jgi:hypothetical protein
MSVLNERAAPSPRPGPGWWVSTAGLLRRAWTYLRDNEFSGLDGIEL